MDPQSQQILLRVQQRAVACVNQAADKFHLLLDWPRLASPASNMLWAKSTSRLEQKRIRTKRRSSPCLTDLGLI